MFAYYLDLARRSFKRNRLLTILMVVAIAFGVGASMTTLTVLHALSGDPMPGKSGDLFYIQVDPRKAAGQRPGEEPPFQMSRYDAEALVRVARADRQALMTGGNAAVQPADPKMEPFIIDTRWSSSEFFTMFRAPFLHGGPWKPEDDTNLARVAVIAKPLAMKLFGKTEVVGQTVRIDQEDLRIVGVLDDWRPMPKFYDITQDVFGKSELLFAPFSTAMQLKFSRSGNMNCWDEAEEPTDVNAPCEWIQFWVELDSRAKADAYRDFLVSYSLEQKAAGRFQREPNVRMYDLMGWLDHRKIVPNDVRLQTWLALGFLLVCLVNTIGLLLTKFLRRSMEIGVRRALGASKRSIFFQLLTEAGVIGLVGGVIGLGLAYLGLWAVRQQPTPYAEHAQMDMSMLGLTFVLAVVSSILAGLLPALRGCQVTPAIQLKSL